MITDWATVAEPVPSPVFTNPCYATDIQILNQNRGIVMVTPDGSFLYRVFVDFDEAISSDPVAAFSGMIPDTTPPSTPPFPVFGQVLGDLMILSPGAGIIMPAGFPSSSPQAWHRMRIDNDGTPGTEPVVVGYWMKIPENSIALAVDVQNNWIFTQDIQIVTPGQGIVMPMRGLASTRRVRLDFDGDIISE